MNLSLQLLRELEVQYCRNVRKCRRYSALRNWIY